MPNDKETWRNISLFRNGRNQAIRIPRDFELPGSEALIRRDGDRLIVAPLPQAGLVEALRGLAALPVEDWPDSIDDPAPEPVEL